MVTVAARRSRLLLVGALLLGACETQPTHEVLSLTDLTPRALEVGERVVLTGAGLPQAQDIHRIRLRFSGTVARPGAASCGRPVVLNVVDPPDEAQLTDHLTGQSRAATYAESALHTVRVDGPNRLEFVLTAAMLDTLSRCPEASEAQSDAPTHATLSLSGARGGVSLQIETAQGTVLSAARALRGPTVELIPHRAALAEELAARTTAERALDTLGLQLAAAHPTEGGLQIERVRPGSAADEAGLSDGDVMVRLDGVTLLGVGDFLPAPSREVSVLTVRRGDALDDRAMRVSSLAPTAPADLVATGVLLLVAMAWLLVARGGGPGSVRWIVRRLGSPERDPSTHHSALDDARRGWRWSWLVGDLRRQLLGLAVFGSTLLCTVLGPLFLGRDLDLAAAHGFVALGSLSLSAFLLRQRGLALHHTARALVDRLPNELLALLPVAVGVMAAGSLHVQDLVDAQGGAPWRFTGLGAPWTALLVVGWWASLVRSTEPGVALDLRAWAGTVSMLWVRAMLGVVVFLGAWRLPGVGAMTQDARASLSMLGALWLSLKAWALVLSALAARRAFARVSAPRFSRFVLRAWLPMSLVAAALSAAQVLSTPRLGSVTRDVLTRSASWATVATLAMALGWITWRRLRPRATFGYAP